MSRLLKFAYIFLAVMAAASAVVLICLILRIEQLAESRIRLASMARIACASVDKTKTPAADLETKLKHENCSFIVLFDAGSSKTVCAFPADVSTFLGSIDGLAGITSIQAYSSPEIKKRDLLSVALPLRFAGKDAICIVAVPSPPLTWKIYGLITCGALVPLILIILALLCSDTCGGNAKKSDEEEGRKVVSDEQILQLGRLASLRQITSGIVHEMNQPLCVMKGYLGLLQMMAQEEEENVSEDESSLKYIETCLLNIDRAVHILEHIRMFVKDGLAEESVDVDMVKSLQNVLDFFGEQFSKRGIKLELNIPQTMATIKVSPALLEQAIIALLANARDSFLLIPPGVAKQVRISLEELRSHIVLTVEDNGSGMDRDTLDHCIDPFFSTYARNAGIGLPLVKIVARKFHGTFRINSVSDHGCTVVLSFPLDKKTDSSKGK